MRIKFGSNVAARDSSLLWHFPHQSNHNGGPYGAVVEGDFKFVENYRTGEFFLFNLANDIGEQVNLFDQQQQFALDLRQDLHDYLWDTEAVLWGGDFELLPRSPEFLLGDCNLDGVVNFLDISPFIAVLTTGVFLDEADTNRDGVVNFLDINTFISILSS